MFKLLILYQKAFELLESRDPGEARRMYEHAANQVIVTINVDPPVKLGPPLDSTKGYVVAVFKYGPSGDLLEAKSIAGEL